MYHRRDHRSRCGGSTGHQLSEQVESISDTGVAAGPTELGGVVDEVCGGQQVQSREGLQRCAFPRRDSVLQRITVEGGCHSQGTSQNGVAVFALAGEVHRTTLESRRRAGRTHRGLGGGGRPATTVGLVPMHRAQSVARTFGRVENSGQFQ